MHQFNLLKYLCISCFLALVFIAIPQAAAWANNEPQALGEQAVSSLDALKKASKYSFDTGGIGVLIRYGEDNGVTAEQVGEAFVKEVLRRGERAKYFYYNANWQGLTVEYHIRHSAMGPWDSDVAASNISKAVARAKAAREIHEQ